MPKQRLDKALSHSNGLARKHSRALIRSGRVTVDGTVVRDSSTIVDQEQIALNGEPVGLRLDIAVFHKPTGVQCTIGDPMGRLSLSEVARDVLAEGLHPVGRLDADTSGLLVFARDGQLTQRLLHPRHAVTKTYCATVEGEPPGFALNHGWKPQTPNVQYLPVPSRLAACAMSPVPASYVSVEPCDRVLSAPQCPNWQIAIPTRPRFDAQKPPQRFCRWYR